MMQFPKTERQAEFMALADQLAASIAARAGEHDRDNTFPYEAMQALHETGYLALTVPEEFGGRGANALEVALAQERLARGDGAVALGVAMHLGTIGRQAETRAWPPEVFAHVCRDVVEHGALINSAASEPDLGSPSRGGLPQTTAARENGGWRLHGRKTWTSLAPALRYFIILATVQEGEQAKRASFLIPADTPGLRVEKTWDNLTMRAIGNDDVVLDNVWVPDDAKLPESRGLPTADPRIWTTVTGAVYLGIATAARDFAVQYAGERRPTALGAPIAALQTVQQRIAEIELLLLQARAVVYGTADAWFERPEGRDAIAWQISAGKYLATNHAIRVTDLALRVVGSPGLSRTLPLERYFRDVRAGLGQPPMDDATLTQIGKAALGL